MIFTGCVFIAKAQPFNFSKPDFVEVKEINPNVKHYKYIYDSIPWNINVVEVTLPDKNISFAAIKGKDKLHDSRENLSSMVARATDSGIKVVAALNTDFFRPDGEIINNQISKGEFVKGISTKRSQLAFTESKAPIIGPFTFTGKIISKNGNTINIDAFNFKRGLDSVVIFNRYWDSSTNTGNDGIEYLLIPVDSIKNGKTCRAVIVSINQNNTKIIKNQYIVSASGKAAEQLKKLAGLNDTISIISGFSNQSELINELIGGLSQIIKNGIDISHDQTLTEGGKEKFRDTRHPRSAIGYNKEKNRIFLVTVDGRQKISAGMALNELAGFMNYLRCYDALNLDGGGSTTIIVNNKIVNSPSDASGERSIGNALLLITE